MSAGWVAGSLRARGLAHRRLRAIREPWIPRLEQALAGVTLALEEQELADAARLRLETCRDRSPVYL
jgi:hypothetical protein